MLIYSPLMAYTSVTVLIWYLLDEMSAQIFCPLFSYFACFLIVGFQEFFVKQSICKYCLWLVFHREDIFNFNEVLSICCPFGIICKKPLKSPGSVIYLSKFCLRSFFFLFCKWIFISSQLLKSSFFIEFPLLLCQRSID